MRLVGRPDLVDEPWFASRHDRAPSTPTSSTTPSAAGSPSATRDEVIARASRRPRRRSRRSTTSPTSFADPQYAALGTITDRRRTTSSGRSRMQNVLFRLSDTPGAIRWTGRPHGADTDAVLAERSA